MGAAEKLASSRKGLVQTVRTVPDPVLKVECTPVLDFDAATADIVADLVATMRALPRCVGLAAPQIGVNKRIVVVDVTGHPKAPPQPRGLLVLVNPVIVARTGSVTSREGCVSVPDFTANVTRAERVAIDYLDEYGGDHALEVSGFEAVAFQHELDHLDGMLFLDRVSPKDIFRRKVFDKAKSVDRGA